MSTNSLNHIAISLLTQIYDVFTKADGNILSIVPHELVEQIGEYLATGTIKGDASARKDEEVCGESRRLETSPTNTCRICGCNACVCEVEPPAEQRGEISVVDENAITYALEALMDAVENFPGKRWKWVRPTVKAYLKHASPKPVSVSLEKCAKAIANGQKRPMICQFDYADAKAVLNEAKRQGAQFDVRD